VLDALKLPEYLRWIGEALVFFVILSIPIIVVGLIVVVLRARRRPVGAAASDTLRDLAVPLSILLIIAFTLGPVSATQIEYPTNIIPFADIIGRMEGPVPQWIDMVDIVGNIVLFVPFGVALAWRWPNGRLRWVVLAAVALSGAIEATQALTDAGRSASTTDIVTNTIGSVVGYLAAGGGYPSTTRTSPTIP
jgi:glycopeptide antibiotics resistance protein